MKNLLLLLLLLLFPAIALAQDDLWSDDAWGEDDWGSEEQRSVWSGFLETGWGTRLEKDTLITERDTLAEVRAQLESEWQLEDFLIGFKADAGYDSIMDDWFGEIRELAASFTSGKSLDVSIGRQVQTWGTGDLVFLNDLFPKDWVSFFSGRDDEYLKAPGNSLRLTHYSKKLNVDLVWTPVFESDNYLDGERFSFFSPTAGANIAPEPPLSALEPARTFENGEFALRLFRTVKGREYALYGYRGFGKQPNALTDSMRSTFAPLYVFGASLRSPMGPGLFNIETAYHMAPDDQSGTNPLLPNDQFRFLSGYEWEPITNFTVAVQYYLEWTLDHDALLDNSPAPEFEADEFRHLLTTRLTYRAGRDKYTWSLFAFYSPSDRDAYLRPKFTYRYSDRWSFIAGGNLFAGDHQHTFFGQLEDASNLYLRLRYNY